VIVEGRADIVTAGAEGAAALDLLREKYAQYRAMGLDPETVVIVRLTPGRLLFWRGAG
jgi:nitroimidazol reductase NimA-like FMN-containing flavoprotein (pyridoxamine 5'-phosphate oxidase superfamily)